MVRVLIRWRRVLSVKLFSYRGGQLTFRHGANLLCFAVDDGGRDTGHLESIGERGEGHGVHHVGDHVLWIDTGHFVGQANCLGAVRSGWRHEDFQVQGAGQRLEPILGLLTERYWLVLGDVNHVT